MSRTRVKVAEEDFLNGFRIKQDVIWNFSSCWLWTRKTGPQGYGIFYCYDLGTLSAHVYSVIRSGRIIPKNMVVDHLCENKNCVNPDHLEVVTLSENSKRYIRNRKKRSDSATFFTTREEERCLWAEYIDKAKQEKLQSIDINIAGFEAQRKFWGAWEFVPVKTQQYFYRWKEEMKLLMEFSDQILTEIEQEKILYRKNNVHLSRLGMIRILVKEALVMRSFASNEDRVVMQELVKQYDAKLRSAGATSEEDPAAPPDKRKRRFLPDDSIL